MPADKILFIATVESHILNFHVPFLKYFQEKGYEVHVATKLGERKQELEQEGVICHNVGFSRSPYSLAVVNALKQLLKIMRTDNFSLVHVHTPMGAFLGRLAARLTNTRPVLYTAHGFHFYKGAPLKNWLIYYSMERVAAYWTDGLITMNKEDYQIAKKFKLRQAEAVFCVHGVGVDLRKYNLDGSTKPLRLNLGIPEDGIIITCVAEFIANKNHVLLLESWRILAEKYTGIYLLFVGDGKLESALKKMVAREKIPRIHFLGFRKDVPAILRESDIVTLVSKREGLPRCIMEPMTCGKPVVASDVRGSRDLVQHNKTGILVPLDGVNELVEAFETLIKDKTLRHSMGEAGRETIQDYAIDSVLKEMDEIYKRYL